MKDFYIGVCGFSKADFDQEEAQRLIEAAFDQVEAQHPDTYIWVVSGLTNLGVPSIAYEEAVDRGWQTMGIACAKALNYELFPVDETIVVGEQWGDESQTFLQVIDVLVRIGGGKQSLAEAAEAARMQLPIIEYELELLTA